MIQLSDVSTGLKTEAGAHDGGAAAHAAQLLTDPTDDIDAKQRYERMRQRDRGRSPASSRSASGPPCRCGPARSSSSVKAEGKTLAVGEAVAAGRVRTADPQYFSAAGIPLLEGREFAATDRDGRRQGRDHQPDARRPVLPRRGPDRQAHRVDRRRAALHALQRRLAHRRRRGRQHPGWRAGRGSRGRWCSCRSRRSWRSPVAW